MERTELAGQAARLCSRVELTEQSAAQIDGLAFTLVDDKIRLMKMGSKKQLCCFFGMMNF
jgi:hypothetical protein